MKLIYYITISIGLLFPQNDDRSTIFSTGGPPNLEEGWELIYNETESFAGAIKFTSPGEYTFEAFSIAIHTDLLTDDFFITGTLHEDNNNSPGEEIGSWEFDLNANMDMWYYNFVADTDCIILEPGESYWFSVHPTNMINDSAIWLQSEEAFTYALSENLGNSWEQTSLGRVGCIQIYAEQIYEPSPDLTGLGDTNQDGYLDVLDVIGIVNFVLGNSNPNIEETYYSDLNQDGNISVLDVVQLVNIILYGVEEESIYIFSLEDINVNSSYYGENVGPDTFISQNNVSCYYFGKAG